MNFGKVKILAGAALIVATLVSTNAHAVGYGEAAYDSDVPAATQQATITQEDVGNFFKGVWGKTKEVAGNVADKSKEVATDATVAVGKGMQKVGQGMQDIAKSEAEKPAPVEDRVVKTKNEKPGKVSKTVKVEEKKIEKAEVQTTTTPEQADSIGQNAIKAKDAVIDGISGFLGKLRSSEPSNPNTPKP